MEVCPLAGTTQLSPIRTAALTVALLVVVAVVAWAGFSCSGGSTVPEDVPVAEDMTVDDLQAAKKKYLKKLRTKREREAFHRGYAMTAAKAATQSAVDENLGESGIAHAERYGKREMEAYAMGIHFALQEAEKGAF